ncbi:MAG: hypothetical protein JNM82_15360 [Rhodocyclaceae bacterium]|nr:hypothetical protein [Rhodocyclaceae bacterium]
MITLEDCAAFCGAEPAQVEAIARREGLPPVLAFAAAAAGQRILQCAPSSPS